jgi:outer membrane receptor protein involved in Fe transport
LRNQVKLAFTISFNKELGIQFQKDIVNASLTWFRNDYKDKIVAGTNVINALGVFSQRKIFHLVLVTAPVFALVLEPSTVPGNGDLKPETSVNKELGIQFQKDIVNASLTWFRNDVRYSTWYWSQLLYLHWYLNHQLFQPHLYQPQFYLYSHCGTKLSLHLRYLFGTGYQALGTVDGSSTNANTGAVTNTKWNILRWENTPKALSY